MILHQHAARDFLDRLVEVGVRTYHGEGARFGLLLLAAFGELRRLVALLIILGLAERGILVAFIPRATALEHFLPDVRAGSPRGPVRGVLVRELPLLPDSPRPVAFGDGSLPPGGLVGSVGAGAGILGGGSAWSYGVFGIALLAGLILAHLGVLVEVGGGSSGLARAGGLL